MKPILQTTFTLFAFLLFAFNSQSQDVTYTTQAGLIGAVSGSSYEDCVVDVNYDNLDDVVRMTSAGVYIDYQQVDGTFDQFFYAMAIENPPTWSLSAGELNGDGYRDFVLGNGSRVSFLMSSIDGQEWTEVTFPEYIFSQRSSMIDIDLDGDLDAFVCHDVDQSHMYYNDGLGNMSLDIEGTSNGVDFVTYNGPGNYANMWVDFDNDGDTDFHLTKCRQGSTAGDDTRINRFYVNNGDGTFTEAGVATNTDDGEQSWTSVWEDFNHDGFFDLFTVNHTGQNSIQLNNGDGTMADNSIVASGITPGDLGAWELDAHDLNNDGYVDIISEMDNALYYGNGDGTFIAGSLGFDDGAFGDLNNDGFLDAVRGNTVYINEGNSNNYVRVNLDGIQSNNDGIGARVEIHTPDGLMQMREVRSGRSFSPMSNLGANFGIGANTTIDEIIVKWPSGLITTIENPAINMAHSIPEADCLSDNIEIAASGVTNICPGESVVLAAPIGGDSYTWSNGGDSNTIEVSQSGVYSVAMYDAEGCVALSNNITVQVVTEEVPNISIQGETTFCDGGSVILTSSDASAYAWSNGNTNQTIEVDESGSYAVTTTGVCSDETSEIVEVMILDTSVPVASDVEGGADEDIILTAAGSGTLTWYSNSDATDVLATGDAYTVPANTLTDATSFWVTNTAEYPGDLQGGGKEELGEEFGLPSTGGYGLMNITEEFTLLDVTVFASGDGDRTFMLMDEAENILEEQTFTLVDGENLVEFNWTVPVGNDISIRSPQNDMFRNNGGINYPYAIGDVGSIYTSSFGNGWYYYFYNWHVQKTGYSCESEAVEVAAVIVGVEEISGLNGLEIYPNPASANLTVSFNLMSNQDLTLNIIDASGKVILTNQLVSNGGVNQNQDLDISSLASGVYSLQIIGVDSDVSQVFVKN